MLNFLIRDYSILEMEIMFSGLRAVLFGVFHCMYMVCVGSETGIWRWGTWCVRMWCMWCRWGVGGVNGVGGVSGVTTISR